MGSIFSRFSLTTASLLAAFLIFGFIAGGVLIHRFETSPSASQQSEQPENQSSEKNDSQDEDAQGDQGDKGPKAPGHSKATGARTIEPPDND